MSIRSHIPTLKSFAAVIADEPLILARVSLRQEARYARLLLSQKAKSCGSAQDEIDNHYQYDLNIRKRDSTFMNSPRGGLPQTHTKM